MAEKQRISGAGGFSANLSPDAFHMWASHYLKCRRDFESPPPFSPAPYFFLCRAIELELKARHLMTQSQEDVKRAYGHHLDKSYSGLKAKDQILTDAELSVLGDASKIYSSKGFEYFDPQDTLTAYARFPSLLVLDEIARKLIESR